MTAECSRSLPLPLKPAFCHAFKTSWGCPSFQAGPEGLSATAGAGIGVSVPAKGGSGAGTELYSTGTCAYGPWRRHQGPPHTCPCLGVSCSARFQWPGGKAESLGVTGSFASVFTLRKDLQRQKLPDRHGCSPRLPAWRVSMETTEAHLFPPASQGGCLLRIRNAWARSLPQESTPRPHHPTPPQKPRLGAPCLWGGREEGQHPWETNSLGGRADRDGAGHGGDPEGLPGYGTCPSTWHPCESGVWTQAQSAACSSVTGNAPDRAGVNPG